MPPALIYAAFSVNLIYQFFTHTERIGTRQDLQALRGAQFLPNA